MKFYHPIQNRGWRQSRLGTNKIDIIAVQRSEISKVNSKAQTICGWCLTQQRTKEALKYM